MEMDNKNNLQSKIQDQNSMLKKYGCTGLYFDLVNCVEKNFDNEKICKEHLKKIGECVVTGMKWEEKLHKL